MTSGTTTLAVLPADNCPDCGRPFEAHTAWEQPALVRHGGYGANARTVLRHCPCGYRLIVEHGEVRP
jgi:hypothetical protein